MRCQHLNLIERCSIGALHAQGLSDREIGAELGRDRTIIWRERQRNCASHDGRYRAERADGHAVGRRRRARRNLRLGRVEWKPSGIAFASAVES